MKFSAWVTRRRKPSRIGLRLFAFNLLVVFVPVAGMLYLDVYEARLLEAQERGMVQQARLVAAALRDVSFDRTRAAALLGAIDDTADTRIRVYDRDGVALADSVRPVPPSEVKAPDAYSQVTDPRRRVLYRVGAQLVRIREAAGRIARRFFGRTDAIPTADTVASGIPVEVRMALAGRYGAAARRTPGQRSLTLSSAVPVRNGGEVVGAVVVSQSTFRILQALYDVRLRLFEIVLLSLVTAAILTAIASSTIVNPILRLQQAAAALASRRKELAGFFSRVKRRDEIGDLARSLEELAAQLEGHIRLLESFSADVSHEFRNPLAAIRTAAETIADAENDEERRRFLGLLLRDVDRLERLVSGVRELAHIDAQVSSEERELVDLSHVLTTVVDGHRMVAAAPLELQLPREALFVRGSSDRLSQVFTNLLENASSFSPADQPIELVAAIEREECVVRIMDRGPGIPSAHVDRIFDRFFSYRPASDRRQHMGLGLAIARAIVSGYDGTISAQNRDNGGTTLEVRLPMAGAPPRTAVRRRTSLLDAEQQKADVS